MRSILLLVLFFTGILLFVPAHDTDHTTEYWESLVTIAAFGLLAVWLLYAVIPRCRDIALPWWSALGMLLPFLNLLFTLLLLFKKKESEGEA